MEALFQNVLTASFHGSVVIAAVILLRLLLRRTPKKYLCLLWLLAGLRLLMPFEIRSDLSLQPAPQVLAQPQTVLQETPITTAPAPDPAPVTDVVQAAPEVQVVQPQQPQLQPAPEPVRPQAGVDLATAAAYVWLAVACGFVLYSLAAYLRLKYRVREATPIPGGWECERIETAFILGFIRPRIYIPTSMSPQARSFILAHERTHLDKGDHWIKMVGYIALALHWFNPLVWAAYVLLCKDIEMACDERVVQFMDLEERKQYSLALLNCSSHRVHLAACPVAFGEVSVKKRIQSVLNYRRPGFWISLAGVAAIAFVAVCLVTSPTEQPAVQESEPEEVRVSTVDDFLAALGPDRRIVLEPGTYDLTRASDYGQTTGSAYYTWEECVDGSEYALCLTGLEGLTIQGSGVHATTVRTDPRNADVLRLSECGGITLSDFTAGHSDGAECGGGVVALNECTGVTMERLGLYGCGMIGLETNGCADVILRDSDVYDCSSTGISLSGSQNVTITGSRFYRIGRDPNGGYAYLVMSGCDGVTVENSQFSDSTLQSVLSGWDNTQVSLSGNLFAGNRIQSLAFDTMDPAFTLADNRFEGNTIRVWTRGDGAVDGSGNALTNEDLQRLYGVEEPQSTQPQLEIHVSTVDELLAAIGPNTDIVLDQAVYDLSTATGYGTSEGAYYYWVDPFDGPALIIRDVENMTIRGASGDRTAHTITATPRYADVLAFQACGGITLSGFTAGHTPEPGACTGGVTHFSDCDHIVVENCGLFGCGILGVETENCSDVTVRQCDIYECSQGGLSFDTTNGVTVEGNTFRDIGGNSYIYFSGCQNVQVDGQSMEGNGALRTQEQIDLGTLTGVLYEFSDAFCTNDTERMALYLSAGYTGTVEGFTGGQIAQCSWTDATAQDVALMDQQGYGEFVSVLSIGSDGQPDPRQAMLHITVVREDGTYKVTDYTLE